MGRRWGFFPICQGGRGDRCCQTALRGLGRRTLRMIELKRKRSIPQELDWDDEDEERVGMGESLIGGEGEGEGE